ncbi:PREDICTED: LEAF RUST 10 DISEASE-RESISTANCE LOCUS RECEPTOR-LIKE PROTEIN KINASE-like 1.5 [Tarenaya hassleriana]|uniref:LEAF RUST 10 DISEASE-RESISTANCE LOCUS RECEPTOR-LIKE PROTEIN KINASE-like 1.5 n=1 Tax=Tarenaya hassleriana TaxID=28532 RepID=UPI00053C32CB|nr:PREDICTED: LEAF RUST 10 DISEASE-RESISTANCE LOCUS RECEPTOR-LIKE PROTEIN KINASE-like 1.5 [Tarenaya hassleriana]
MNKTREITPSSSSSSYSNHVRNGVSSPLQSFPLAVLLLCSIFAIVEAASSSYGGDTCPPSSSSSFPSHCPPFNSSPPFPFSSSPGCGHPNFQIHCVSPRATVSINNLSFSLLRYDAVSNTLLLSPVSPPPHSPNRSSCSSHRFTSVPDRVIDLTGSPFRVSDSSCSRLSLLRPCSRLILPKCSHCPWDCKLLENPGLILQGCEHASGSSSLSEQGCQGDIFGFLDDFFSRFGFEVEWDESQDPYFVKCRACRAKNGVCGFNSSDPDKGFLCFQARSELSPIWVSRDKRVDHVAVLCLIFALTCLLMAISVSIAIFRSRSSSLSSANEEDPAALFLRRHRFASLLPPVFTYEELESATNKFDPKRKIGDGGFGSVYLGHLHDGQLVAVKHLHHHGKAFSMKSFCNEILILSSINHPNLVKLHGYCSDPRGLLLVYDYVPNGTLADHLHGRTGLCRKMTLTWQLRLDIALQTALALEYLHFAVAPPVVHRDITSSNIFVEKDMMIKVGDFGLSRVMALSETTVATSASSSDYVCTGPQGTPGYLDPDYHRSFRLTEKSDVYSYGVVLMELMTGMKAVDQCREKPEMALADLVVSKIQMGLLDQVVDPLLVQMSDGNGGGVAAVAELAFRCVAADKDDRPDSREIVAQLRRIVSRTRGDDVAKG